MKLTFQNRHLAIAEIVARLYVGERNTPVARRYGLQPIEVHAIEMLLDGARPAAVAANFEELSACEMVNLLQVLTVCLLRSGRSRYEVATLLGRTGAEVDAVLAGYLHGPLDCQSCALRPELVHWPPDEPEFRGVCPDCCHEVELPCTLCLAGRARYRARYQPYPLAPYTRITSYAACPNA